MSNAENLIQAVQAGNSQAVRELLSEDAGLAGSRDAHGVSAIMHAVYRGQKECLELLRQKHGTPDIFEAVLLGDVKALAALLAKDTEQANSYSADGFTALHFAAYFGQPAAATLLLANGAEVAAVARNPTMVTPLHSAVSSGNVEVTRELLQRGAPVNARQQHGWTPLHAAAQNGNLEILELLLQSGADASIKNEEGVTALDLARKHGHGDVIRRLG